MEKPGFYKFKNPEIRKKWQDHLDVNEKENLNKIIASMLISKLPVGDNKTLTLVPYLLNISNDVETVYWLVEAGDLYLKNFQVANAFECYDKALLDLHDFSSKEADILFAETAVKYSSVTYASPSKLISFLTEAKARAARRGLQISLALIELYIGQSEWISLRYSKALNHFQKGLSMAAQIDNPKLSKMSSSFKIHLFNLQGKFRDAVTTYEQFAPEVHEIPESPFEFETSLRVGYCYGRVGEVTQSLGMLDTLRNKCIQMDNVFMTARAELYIGLIMFDLRRMEEAFQYIESALDRAMQVGHGWVQMTSLLVLAYAHNIKGNKDRSLAFLKEYLQIVTNGNFHFIILPYLMDLSWSMEEGNLPKIEELSLQNQIDQMIHGENLVLKGVAYKYKAKLQKKQGAPPSKIIYWLNKSISLLEESGDATELAKSKMELIRQGLSIDHQNDVITMANELFESLSDLNEDLIPEDLKFIKTFKSQKVDPLDEILEYSQRIATIRDNKDLVQQIIATVNKITGAERGAIFLWDHSDSRQLLLRASKNLTADEIKKPEFTSSMKMIKEVANSNRGQIIRADSDKKSKDLISNIIRCRICVPLILKGRNMGVLYHDNRLLSSVFQDSDLKILSHFASQAAFALDNAKAYEEIQNLNEKLKRENIYYQNEQMEEFNFEEVVGKSQAIKKVFTQVEQVAKTDANVLILGETGVGKELIARAIHRRSQRCGKAFIRVFGNAIPENLIASELFGYEKGAFTGAVQRRIGRFELADGGTIFIDEIGELPLDIQVLLLNVLQTKEFERVGGSETIYSDFRLIAATNRDLEQMVKSQKFRADLYYRLNVFPISVPPVRGRKEDIPLLVNYFIKRYATKFGKTFDSILESDMKEMAQYSWPGNVRELENTIERGCIISEGPTFHFPDLRVNSTLSATLKLSLLLLKMNVDILFGLWKILGGRYEAEGEQQNFLIFIITPWQLACRSLESRGHQNFLVEGENQTSI